MGRHSNHYTVAYRMYWSAPEQEIQIPATSKADAYDKATFEAIPKKEGRIPYSSWVTSVTYQNGNYHRFNTIEGMGY